VSRCNERQSGLVNGLEYSLIRRWALFGSDCNIVSILISLQS
jgi:hypothetical protein